MHKLSAPFIRLSPSYDITNKLNQLHKTMKKYLTRIALVFLPFLLNAQETKEYHNNGELKTIGFKKNGKNSGEWRSYFETGNLNKLGTYTSGNKEGEWKYYHSNGALRIIGKYKAGKDMGEWKYYYENKQLRAIGLYTNGLMTGIWKHYHKNGQLLKTGERAYGKDIGTWKHYDEHGSLLKVEQPETAKEAIVRNMNYYFDGTRTDNPALLKKAFHPDATLKFIDAKGTYQMRSIQTFFSYFTNTKTRSFQGNIDYIDISGTTANVKLTTTYETYRYIDYLNMLKTKDGWKIVGKIAHQEFF